MGTISEELLEKLVCPVSHAPLVEVGDWLYSTDARTRRRYPIRDGIAIMLVDESQEAGEVDFAQAMAAAGRGEYRAE